jgi:UTP--glucose-1-phosphate uridylyltransferase
MKDDQQPVKTAIIAAAGLGTRFLPETKSIPKEMLPIIDKPVLQLIVGELMRAGVTEIIIVIDDTKQAIKDHFSPTSRPEYQRWEGGNSENATELKAIIDTINFTYIKQTGTPRGNARPIINAMHLLENKPFFAFFGDNFFTGHVSRVQQLLEAYQKTGTSVAALVKVKHADADKYGMATIGDQIDDNIFKLNGLVEKPGLDNSPSNFAVCGGYLLTPDILPLIAQEKAGAGGEITLSESVNKFAQDTDVYGKLIDGEYYDTGIPENYLQTLIDIALADPRYSEGLRQYLESRLEK